MKKTIFLSYRRDDNPGYVRQLQEDLQEHFGENSVFRDVEHISGGQQWKEVLATSLARSVALIVVIGPRWEQIWRERVDEENDYIVFELNKARELNIPIYPVTINGTTLSTDLDLGSIAWLMDKQHYDISDRQGRWPTDVLGLVSLLEREKGLTRKRKNESSGGKAKYLLLLPVLLLVFAFIGFFIEQEEFPPEQGAANYDLTPASPAVNAPTEFEEPDQVAIDQSNLMFPDITGVWHDDEGTAYEIDEVMPDGSFLVHSNYSVGVGQFVPNMPRKFLLQAADVGYGEYSVSNDNQKIMGWFYFSASNETLYGSLWRANE